MGAVYATKRQNWQTKLSGALSIWYLEYAEDMDLISDSVYRSTGEYRLD